MMQKKIEKIAPLERLNALEKRFEILKRTPDEAGFNKRVVPLAMKIREEVKTFYDNKEVQSTAVFLGGGIKAFIMTRKPSVETVCLTG